MKLRTCEECGSPFNSKASVYRDLCAECAHQIYGQPACDHEFAGGRCGTCGWDGSRSDYVRRLPSSPTVTIRSPRDRCFAEDPLGQLATRPERAPPRPQQQALPERPPGRLGVLVHPPDLPRGLRRRARRLSACAKPAESGSNQSQKKCGAGAISARSTFSVC
jgi:hypothetical protein